MPAFTGLGAPYWRRLPRRDLRADAQFRPGGAGPRGAGERGLPDPRPAGGDEAADWAGEAGRAEVLRVDGGMSASDWAMQFLADIIDAPVDRPEVLETTALGAAWLAGMRAGVYPEQADFAKTWALERQFTPSMDASLRDAKYGAWQRAVQSTLAF